MKMRRLLLALFLAGCGAAPDPAKRAEEATMTYDPFPHYRVGTQTLVAHRGASAYAPEHTLEAYGLALQQGADFVEQDFQMTSDGVLVCLHDRTLQRTTDVEQVFPRRFQEVDGERQWFVHDFTLEELKRLDAGSWFDSKFAGARIPTFDEAVELVRGKAGLFAELKDPQAYRDLGFELEKAVLDSLEKHGLDRPEPDTPVILQTFDADCARRLTLEMGTRLPVVLLLGRENFVRWSSREGLREAAAFAAGIGPGKALLQFQPAMVDWAHGQGLSVTPYTFRASDVGEGFATVQEEMRHYLDELGVDALFTDNPDLFPR